MEVFGSAQCALGFLQWRYISELPIVLAYDASDIYDVVFSQLFSSPRTRIARLERSRLRELVEKIALSRKLKFPLKTYLGCRMAQRRAHEIAAEISPISEGTNWCVILLADQLRYERSGLAKEIKKVLPSAKIVVFLLDLIAKNADKQDLVQSKNKTVDTIVSFDSGEATGSESSIIRAPFRL